MVAAENRKRLPAKTSGTTATVALLETRLNQVEGLECLERLECQSQFFSPGAYLMQGP